MKVARVARRVALLGALLALSSCASWHVLQPTTANNVQVGELMMYVTSAEYADSGGRVKVVIVLDNRTQQPQQFDPQWVQLRGASGAAYPAANVHPPMATAVMPFSRLQLVYLFRRVPQPDTGQMALLVAGTTTMQFAGFSR